MTDNQGIEKSVPQQVIDKMLEKLTATSCFSEVILNELKNVDLTNKEELTRIISNVSKSEQNENSETGD